MKNIQAKAAAGAWAQLKFIFTTDGFYLDQMEGKRDEKTAEWERFFQENRLQALYQFGLEEKPENISPSAAFLYQVSDGFFKTLTDYPELEIAREALKPVPSTDTLELLLSAVPFAVGSEYLTQKWLKSIFKKLSEIFSREISAYDGTVEMYLTEKSQHLRVPERVFFHLVESKEDDYPFAFLATYATKDKHGKIRHVPLRYALTEYKNEREKLLTLLACLNRAAEVSPLISDFVEKGEMFHPLRLTSQEAYEFLKALPAIEGAGIQCRIPNWWKKHAASVSMSVSLGDEAPAMLGFDSLISMKPSLTVDGVRLTEEDIRSLLEQTEGLAWLKGKWVEVDHAVLQKLLDEMENFKGDVSLFDALRMELDEKGKISADTGTLITNGIWLSELLQKLRSPQKIRTPILPKTFQASLRPYQKTGYTWLNYMKQLGFGACLADDMGLGKTVQVLAFLERLRKDVPTARILLVVPASLLGNWQKETARFAPKMDFIILHGRTAPALEEELKEQPVFLTITTYGMTARLKGLLNVTWNCIILDEAQAIKNPVTRQTKAVKKLKGQMRIAMTGTPIENELTNLWSLFDFLNKGLLGTSKEFHDFSKGLVDHPEGYTKLKTMVSPFILRRLKTDKKIISDLPDKLETVDFVNLSAKQVVLYRRQVSELEQKIKEKEGIERRGLVLATIMKLKQICNHPDQFLGETAYNPEESGKFELLKEICETIYEKRERVLVFTQFKEITENLAEFLEEIFHAKGLILHGGTRISRRSELVDAFNGEAYVPFMVLSVKAGGTGLNLTKANHVIHFDRWWNPAVENQATDRAYRIGQTKNVMVHKLVSEGTIEEKIDAMINSKKELAENVIGSGGESWITELGNDELMSILRLD